ncbi:hypothetical protein OUZ56_014272 [Daphnia magna]|uniref:Uncharacterized protein n=1 Tax=Daphnia magna TaxID=35525 RepID=A0ABR0AJN5_9CRUS|nr:hypothetical protein OUZ56_014272 [Daphnia magna]
MRIPTKKIWSARLIDCPEKDDNETKRIPLGDCEETIILRSVGDSSATPRYGSPLVYVINENQLQCLTTLTTPSEMWISNTCLTTIKRI